MINNVHFFKVLVSLEIKYLSPDGMVGDWGIEDFAPPKLSDTISSRTTSSSTTSKHR